MSRWSITSVIRINVFSDAILPMVIDLKCFTSGFAYLWKIKFSLRENTVKYIDNRQYSVYLKLKVLLL